MAPPKFRRSLATYLVSVAMALSYGSGAERILAAVTAGVTIAALPLTAEAQSRGYSRPRTPSVRPVPRAPPSSGGYRRPSVVPRDGFGAARPPPRVPSPSDRALGRQGAGEALQRYRLEQERQRLPPPEAAPSRRPGTSPLPDGGWGSRRYGGPFGGWSPPPYAFGRPSFGIWDALFLWFMLDTLSRPGHAEFFHNQQNDPGYKQWREEAERQAQDNAELRAKLDQLDRELAERKEQPRDPNYLPPDASPNIALAERDATSPARRAPAEDGSALLMPLAIGGGTLLLLWFWRRRIETQIRTRSGGGSTMTPLGTATNILRRKITGEGYTPSLFRVGMTVTIDPTPFILATGATKVPVPPSSGGNLLVSVQTIGTLRDGVTLYRLYLDERRFFQLHLDQAGIPDECRYFGRIDEVEPASPEDWAFWIDEREGMIGWPEFQTKDGKLYSRVWAPGEGRIPPQHFTETREDVRGTRTFRHEAMLYAAPTGAAAPAPETEYVLVDMVESEGSAWIEILAGIDVNPAALSLS